MEKFRGGMPLKTMSNIYLRSRGSRLLPKFKVLPKHANTGRYYSSTGVLKRVRAKKLGMYGESRAYSTITKVNIGGHHYTKNNDFQSIRTPPPTVPADQLLMK